MTATPSVAAEAPARTTEYRPELDGLRGVAIALVVFVHLYLPNTDQVGWIGVQIFFVLSGFLITRLLVSEHARTGRIDLGAFYVRRVRRLVPALALVIVVVTAFEIGVVRENGLERAGWVVAYLANWRIAAGGYLSGLSHTWSLAIEEQFYLLWPIVLLVALRAGGWRLGLAIAVAIALGSLALRTGLWLATANEHRVYFGSDTRIDALMAGSALAILAPRWLPGRSAIALAGVVIAAVCLVPVSGHQTFLLIGGLSATIVATGALVLSRGGVLAATPLVALGRLSYSLYLWHYPIMYGARQLFGFVPLWTIPLALAAAWLSFRFVERPFRVHAPGADVAARGRDDSAPGSDESAGAQVAKDAGLSLRTSRSRTAGGAAR